jgi:hypothetical protein
MSGSAARFDLNTTLATEFVKSPDSLNRARAAPREYTTDPQVNRVESR